MLAVSMDRDGKSLPRSHTATMAEGCRQLRILITMLACLALSCQGPPSGPVLKVISALCPGILYSSSGIIDVEFSEGPVTR